MIGDDVALRDGEDQRAVRPIAAPFLVHILYDDAILRQLLDVTVGGGDNLLAVRTEHAPFLPLTHEEIALCIGAYLVVLCRDHGGARRRDGTPFPCGLDEGERCRMDGGGRLLPAVDQHAHPRVERVVVDGFGGGVRHLCRDQACGGERDDGGAQTRCLLLCHVHSPLFLDIPLSCCYSRRISAFPAMEMDKMKILVAKTRTPWGRCTGFCVPSNIVRRRHSAVPAMDMAQVTRGRWR